jgi:hypothetical protein
MLIDVIYAFDDVTKDPSLGEKLAIGAALAAFTLIPFIGLIGLAALMGYQLDLMRNVRDDVHPPLPVWRDYGAKIITGGEIMTAWFIYNIPNGVWLCIASTLWFNNPGGALVLACCTLPVLVVINLFTIPLYTLGLVRYMDDPRKNVGTFFQVGALGDTLRQNIVPIIQWWLFSTLVNLTGVFIPCVGWLALLVLGVPLNGHMLGQLAASLRGANASRRKR